MKPVDCDRMSEMLLSLIRNDCMGELIQTIGNVRYDVDIEDDSPEMVRDRYYGGEEIWKHI